ncbi:MAG: anthranilate phosphoribosyltransferase [Rhizomicrobium sp.]|jgi:anthranilate phosphoribosyltransferase
MSSASDFSTILRRVVGGETLDAETSALAFGAIMSGSVSEPQIAGFLTALTMRDVTVDEIIGAAAAMRSAMHAIRAPEGAIDLCGTGGDGHATLNVSTAASFVVAACGVPVAKHGNRNMSSRSGAADVLESLGVRIDLAPSAAEECLSELGLCFLFAPTYHPAMKHVANVRKQLGFRTVFNLLGPICNPAGVARQLIGVFSRPWIGPVARVLKELGTDKAWVVHGMDGLDEVTTTDATDIAVLSHGSISSMYVTPETVGISRTSLADLKGGGPTENAAAIRRLLSGDRNPFRDITLLNSAAALVVADKAGDLRAGIDLAEQAIDSGAATDVLARLAAATQAFAA